MKTVTVKLNKSDYEMLNQVVEWLQQDWIEKMTKSEAIRYAIYDLYCQISCSFYDEPNACFNCTKEHYLKMRQSNKSDT